MKLNCIKLSVDWRNSHKQRLVYLSLTGARAGGGFNKLHQEFQHHQTNHRIFWFPELIRVFWGLQNQIKLIFSKKPNFCDLSEHGGGQGSGPSHPDRVSQTSWCNSLNPLPALALFTVKFLIISVTFLIFRRKSYHDVKKLQLITSQKIGKKQN